MVVIGIVLAAGGLGLGLAWKTGLFGKPGGGPTDGTTTNGTQPQPPPSDGEEDQTKDWEVYTSVLRGFTTKYPPDWVAYEDENYMMFSSPDLVESAVGYPVSGRRIDISASLNSAGKSASQVVEDVKDSAGTEVPIIFYGMRGEAEVGGTTAVVYEADFELLGQGFSAVAVYGGKIYDFRCYYAKDAPAEEKDQCLQVLKLLLSTVSFQ